MSTYEIFISNNNTGCTEVLSSSTTVASCTVYYIRVPQNTNGDGPFNIYTGSTMTTPIYSNITKEQLFSGVSITLCP